MVEEQPHVRERGVIRLVLERAQEDGARRDEQERDRVREERQRRDPGERRAPPAGREVRPEGLRCSFGRDAYPPTFVGHWLAISAFFAADCWPRLANFTLV